MPTPIAPTEVIAEGNGVVAIHSGGVTEIMIGETAGASADATRPKNWTARSRVPTGRNRIPSAFAPVPRRWPWPDRPTAAG